jgi:hypothetical protein
MRRSYAGGAKQTQLTTVLNGTTAALTIECADLSNYPTGAAGPFYVVVDRNQVTEEKILCSSRSGNTLTVFSDGLTTGRGADGTVVVTHAVNAQVEHVFTATDADEANAHVNTVPLHIQSNQKAVNIATSATRPSPPATNQIILQTDTSTMFAYIGGVWREITSGGATGGGSNKVFFENDLTISEDYTLTTSTNAGTFGPVSIDSGVTVTVPSGQVWTVV